MRRSEKFARNLNIYFERRCLFSWFNFAKLITSHLFTLIATRIVNIRPKCKLVSFYLMNRPGVHPVLHGKPFRCLIAVKPGISSSWSEYQPEYFLRAIESVFTFHVTIIINKILQIKTIKHWKIKQKRAASKIIN